MIAMGAGEHVIILSGYGPLISDDHLSQNGFTQTLDHWTNFSRSIEFPYCSYSAFGIAYFTAVGDDQSMYSRGGTSHERFVIVFRFWRERAEAIGIGEHGKSYLEQ